MAISSFIPKVWSARLQENFHKALVFGSLCSRNYEGEISQWGDTVHISNLSDITVRPYDPTKDLAEPEALSGTDIVLTTARTTTSSSATWTRHRRALT